MLDTSTFWQANIWGIIGTLLGFFALLASFIGSYHSRPKLALSKLDLIRKNPMQISEWFGHRTKEQMRDHILYFELNVTIKNDGTRPCSVEKPSLILSLPSGKKIRLEPYKAHSEAADKTNESAWNTRLARTETAWELKGRQALSDEIRYVVQDIDDLYDIVNGYSATRYSIQYSDNLGKKYSKRIASVLEES